MNEQDEIIEMARQAGFVEYELDDGTTNAFDKRYEAFAKLVAAKATDEANERSNASWTLMCKKMVDAEREACAKVCDDMDSMSDYYGLRVELICAQAIRARGEA